MTAFCFQYALHVYDSLMAEGKNFGIRNAGYYALRALRTEKFFAYWGTDLTPFTTPMECGREFRVKLNVSNLRKCGLELNSTNVSKVALMSKMLIKVQFSAIIR